MIKQTEAQFKSLHGEHAQQSKTARACFDVLFNGTYRGVASREHEVSEACISRFMLNNERKHLERYSYVDMNPKP